VEPRQAALLVSEEYLQEGLQEDPQEDHQEDPQEDHLEEPATRLVLGVLACPAVSLAAQVNLKIFH